MSYPRANYLGSRPYFGLSSADVDVAQPLTRQQFALRRPFDVHLYPWQKQRIVDFLRTSPPDKFGEKLETTHILNHVIAIAWPCLSEMTGTEKKQAAGAIVHWINRKDANARFIAGHVWSDKHFPDPQEAVLQPPNMLVDDHVYVAHRPGVTFTSTSANYPDIHSHDIFPPPSPGVVIHTTHDVRFEQGWTLPKRSPVLVLEIQDMHWCWVSLNTQADPSPVGIGDGILIPTRAVSPAHSQETEMMQAGGFVQAVRSWKGELQQDDRVEVVDVGRSWCLVKMQYSSKVINAPRNLFRTNVNASGKSNLPAPPPHTGPRYGEAPTFGNSDTGGEQALCSVARAASSYHLPSVQCRVEVLYDYKNAENDDEIVTRGESVCVLNVEQYWSLVRSEEDGFRFWVPHWVIAKPK